MKPRVNRKLERGELVQVTHGDRGSGRKIPSPRTVAAGIQRARARDGDAGRRAARRTPALHLHRVLQPRRVLRSTADRAHRGDARGQDRTGRHELPVDPGTGSSPRASPVRALQRTGDAGARQARRGDPAQSGPQRRPARMGARIPSARSPTAAVADRPRSGPSVSADRQQVAEFHPATGRQGRIRPAVCDHDPEGAAGAAACDSRCRSRSPAASRPSCC